MGFGLGSGSGLGLEVGRLTRVAVVAQPVPGVGLVELGDEAAAVRGHEEEVGLLGLGLGSWG